MRYVLTASVVALNLYHFITGDVNDDEQWMLRVLMSTGTALALDVCMPWPYLVLPVIIGWGMCAYAAGCALSAWIRGSLRPQATTSAAHPPGKWRISPASVAVASKA